jgi:acetoin utilization deacetylase AcuC-like enzyme
MNLEPDDARKQTVSGEVPEAGESQATTALVCDAMYKNHQTGPGHPERPERLDAVQEGLANHGLIDRLAKLAPRECRNEDLLLCHTQQYVATVGRDVRQGGWQLSTGDTTICPESLEVARYAVGGVLHAVEAVCEGRVRNAFCAVRPPGHHATAMRGMGFCIFNNVAVAARHAQRKHGIEKVLIVDWDVHHGNGTQDIFYDDASVLYFSTHQWPWYPGSGGPDETGHGNALGTTVNVPMSAGTAGADILAAFTDRLLPAANRFKPDLTMISAGFDSRVGDPLGHFKLSDEDFVELTRIMLSISGEHSEGRLVSMLEGGYSLDGLGRATAAHVGTLLEH